MANMDHIETVDTDPKGKHFANPMYDNFAEEFDDNVLNNNNNNVENKGDRSGDDHMPSGIDSVTPPTSQSVGSASKLLVRPQPRERTTIKRKSKKNSEVVYTNVPKVCDNLNDHGNDGEPVANGLEVEYTSCQSRK